LKEKFVPMPLRLLPCLFLAAASFVLPHPSTAQVLREPLPLHAAVQDKNFYLLSLLQADPAVRRVLTADPSISQISAERQRFLAVELRTCHGDAVCTLRALLWTDEEIRAVSFALARIYRENESVRALVNKQVLPSGAYVLYQKQDGESVLVNAWELCARGVNDILSVYGQGLAPRYPDIDAISFDVTSADFQQQVTALATRIAAESFPSDLFFEPSLKAALQLLTLNHRDEAGRLEPMEARVNAAAVKSIPSIPWEKYANSVIVVPGAGPDDPNTALSDAGRKRTELAVAAYRAGLAPFILVSGGYVHPARTRFAEALEMKKALLEDYHVPEAAILVDPHARHTTTNLRDAVREIYRYNIPMDKPALVVSDPSQIAYIASQSFSDRCLKEMGYLPYRLVSQPSKTSLVFLPMIESLQQDPQDPLDP
jgi:hypothetical protein